MLDQGASRSTKKILDLSSMCVRVRVAKSLPIVCKKHLRTVSVEIGRDKYGGMTSVPS